MKIEFSKFLSNEKIPNIDLELTESDCAKAFGLSLRRLRKYKNLTLDELSAQVEITNPTLNRYESGYNLPSIYMGLKIVNFFDTTMEIMLLAGILELHDINNGTIKEENKYIEQFVDLSKSLNNVLGVKNRVSFLDHKKKRG